MNPPDQPTQPSETHKQLAADVFRMVHNRDLTAAAQLIADSEARAVAEATKQLRSELNYAKASETLYHDEGTAALAALTAERERTRVLREALKPVARFPMERHQDLAKSALASTEEIK
jgi:hypothetical protein